MFDRQSLAQPVVGPGLRRGDDVLNVGAGKDYNP
jgi:hypothetical protein